MFKIEITNIIGNLDSNGDPTLYNLNIKVVEGSAIKTLKHPMERQKYYILTEEEYNKNNQEKENA